MSTNGQTPLSQPTSVVRNTLGKKPVPQDPGRSISDEALREYCDRNNHQILPIIAEKVHQEKVQQEKLKAVKARLNFEETSHHSESGTPTGRRGLKERLGPRHVRSRSGSPKPRRGRSEAPKKKGSEKKTVFKRLEKGVFHRLGDKEKSVSVYSGNSRRRSYHSSGFGKLEHLTSGNKFTLSRFVFLFGLPGLTTTRRSSGSTVKGYLKTVFESGFCDREDFKGSWIFEWSCYRHLSAAKVAFNLLRDALSAIIGIIRTQAVMSADSAVTYTSVHSEARSWSIPSEDPYEEAAQQLFEQAPRHPEYVPENHIPVYIPEPEHPEDFNEAEHSPYYHSVHPSGTPTVLPIPLLHHLEQRADVPEANAPPEAEDYYLPSQNWCEIGESSAAAAARQPGPTIETRLLDTERRMMTALELVNRRISYQIEILRRRETCLYEQESIQSRQDLARSEAYSRTLEARITLLETEARRHEWQRQAADDLAVQHIMRTQALWRLERALTHWRDTSAVPRVGYDCICYAVVKFLWVTPASRAV
ncbi:hypothetical protein Tco_0348531 [Tanacetum coccineum]